jgi:hypothetical protein
MNYLYIASDFDEFLFQTSGYSYLEEYGEGGGYPADFSNGKS